MTTHVTDPRTSLPTIPDGWTEAEWVDFVNALTRRKLIGGALATVLLAACGGNIGEPPTAEPDTRVVNTADGDVIVPADPKRVVCIDYFTAIFLIELGLTPAGAIDYSWIDDTSMFPEYVAPLKALPNIGQITATNFEAVTKLGPDLILGPTPGSRYDNSKGAMAKLKAVAPVASVDFGQSGDWRGPFAQTAAIINRNAKLQPLRAAYEQAVSAARTRHSATLGATVLTVLDYASDGEFSIDLPKSGSGVVLTDLGVHFGKATVDDGTSGRMLSFERLNALDDSDIILFRADANGKPMNGLEDVFALSTWKSLPAVRQGHVYPVGWLDLCTYRWAELAITDYASILDRYASA